MNSSEQSNELINFLKIAKNIKPDPGEIPEIKGLDIYGETIPLNGDVSGDHIIYVDFAKRFNIKERILRAGLTDNIEIIQKLEGLKNKAGILLADVSGHSITDSLLNAMLHQSFLVGAGYELTMFGEITTDLFEAINQRFYQSSSIDKYITMIYGEIQNNGDFRFITAGHQHPFVFSKEYNKIVNIDDKYFVNYPPIGTLPSEADIDSKLAASIFGYKKKYSVNCINVMGIGDILILFTDGFTEQRYGELNYVKDRLEEQLIKSKHLPAKNIFMNLKEDFKNYCPAPDDDATMILIKRA
ncbi:MAG TPA: PP2C family protein-serine/threonine phosphatase [Ignavibacteriaceae bacterium]|nr:PP2C family protein-serine/threonine phosphatase [Ignavibacteriaceae bacterium]